MAGNVHMATLEAQKSSVCLQGLDAFARQKSSSKVVLKWSRVAQG